MASQALTTEGEGKMEETTEYTRRLQAITEKRKLQEEIDRKRRELEEERLKLQQLKRKSLRDRWLMEATSPPPLEPESSSPLEQSQAYIQRLQDELDSLQSQMSHLENHTFGSAGPVKATAQSLGTALQQSTVMDSSAQLSVHKSEKGDDNTVRPLHGEVAQEEILHAQTNGVMANSIEKEPIAEVSSKEVEIQTSSVFHGQMDIGSERERVDSLHLEAASANKMENHREQVQMENGLEVGVSNRNTEKLLEEPNNQDLNLYAPEICLDRLKESHMVSESTTAFCEGETCTVDINLDSTRAHQLPEGKADNGYISLVSKGTMLAAEEPGSGLGTVLRAERVMITEDGEEVLVKALEGYVSNDAPHNMEGAEGLLKRHIKGIGSGHLGVMEHESDETQNTFKGVDHAQAVQILSGKLHEETGSQGDLPVDASTLMGQAVAIPGKITTFVEETLSTVGQKPAVCMVSEDKVKITVEKKTISLKGQIGELPEQISAAEEQLPSIQGQIPKLNVSVQEPVSNIQESIQEHISDLQASIQGQLPKLQTSIQEPISILQSSIQGHIPSLQASIQEPISNLEASIQGQIPRLQASIQEPISDLQASIQGQIPNLKASIEEPVSNLQASIQGQIPNLKASIEEPVSNLQASIHGQIPNLQASIQEPISSLQASIQDPILTLQSSIDGQIPKLQSSIQEPISNVEAFFQGQIPSLQASIQEPITNLQTSIKGQIPNLQDSLQEPISTIQSSIQEQAPSLQASIQKPVPNIAASIQGELPSLQTSIKESILSAESTIEGQFSSLQASTQDRISDLHASIKGEMLSLETSTQGQIPSLQASIQEPITNFQTSIQGQIQNCQSSIQGLIPSIQESVQVQTSGLMEGKTIQKITGDFGQTFTTAHKVSENMSPEQQPLLEEVNLSEIPAPSIQQSLSLSTTPKDVLTKPLVTKTQEGPAYTANTAQASPHRSTDTQVDGIAHNRPKQKTCQCCTVM